MPGRDLGVGERGDRVALAVARDARGDEVRVDRRADDLGERERQRRPDVAVEVGRVAAREAVRGERVVDAARDRARASRRGRRRGRRGRRRRQRAARRRGRRTAAPAAACAPAPRATSTPSSAASAVRQPGRPSSPAAVARGLRPPPQCSAGRPARARPARRRRRRRRAVPRPGAHGGSATGTRAPATRAYAHRGRRQPPAARPPRREVSAAAVRRGDEATASSAWPSPGVGVRGRAGANGVTTSARAPWPSSTTSRPSDSPGTGSSASSSRAPVRAVDRPELEAGQLACPASSRRPFRNAAPVIPLGGTAPHPDRRPDPARRAGVSRPGDVRPCGSARRSRPLESRRRPRRARPRPTSPWRCRRGRGARARASRGVTRVGDADAPLAAGVAAVRPRRACSTRAGASSRVASRRRRSGRRCG